MAYELKRIYAEQNRVVRSLFIDTADDNYIAARWCFVEGLNVDYFWLSVHALEKYMKAALLLNGRSSKEYAPQNGNPRQYKHDITALYEQIGDFASDLLPSKLNKPSELELHHWRDETPDAFIRRIYRDGNADNRYQIFGFVQHHEDLFKLDLMAFALRRLCVHLDAYFVGKPQSGTRRPTHRDVLKRQPEWWSVSAECLLEKTVHGKRGENLRKVLLNLNIPFAPQDFVHSAMRSRTASRNPVLARSILEPLQRAPAGTAVGVAAELCDWVIDNIHLPKEVVGQLRQATQKRKP
ncbi:MAG: hypothetical protein OXF79_27655 [Chloroflexi bacterium]|nr:hypothetical protein [Chloroflexota bacterium]